MSERLAKSGLARARLWACAGVLLTLACGGGAQKSETKVVEVKLPAQRLSEARKRADAQPADGVAAARAGWLEYLVGSDPKAALVRFEAALAAPGKAPEAVQLALAGRGEILEDRLDGRGAAQAFRDALAADTKSGIAELCALRLLDEEGDSEAVDEVVLEAAGLFAQGGNPRAARIAREAAARVKHSRALATDAGPEEERLAWAALGIVQEWRIGGPYSALRLLSLGRALALDGPELAGAPETGPSGTAPQRALSFPDGDVGLELEPLDGDVFYAASEVTATGGGEYLAWIEGASALELRIDGQVVLSRSPWPREMPRSQQAAVRLAPGAHAVLVRWSRAESGRFRLALVRSDGRPSDLRSRVPDELRGQRLASTCVLGTPCLPPGAWVDPGGLRAQAERSLIDDEGDPLAAFLLSRTAWSEDRTVARRALDRLVNVTANGAPALALRANFTLRDPEIPERLGRASALADLGRAAATDPQLLRARLTAAALQRDSERLDEASQELTAAEQSAPSQPARLLLAKARLAEQQGNPAGQKALAAQALAQEPGRCDARQMLFDLARREGGVAEQERLAVEVQGCVEARSVLLAFLRERRRLDVAEAVLRRIARLRPAMPQRLEQLAEVQLARADLAGAIGSLRLAAGLVPRSAEPWRRLAEILDLSGDREGALAARTELLARAPGDLRVRRQLAKDRGAKLLAWTDRDGAALARTHDDTGLAQGAERPAAVRLLDHGAVEFFADGSAIERSHTVARLLDKKGISRFGEAQVPGDAEILNLRTIKADGRVLEPDAIPNKDTVSLPGLEPGDAIEIDWLRPWAPRGADLRGLSLSGFYFRDDETPMGESTFEARAPASVPLEVDAHNLTVGKVESGPDGWHWRHSERTVAPKLPEPGQPGEAELGPWVQLGWGAGQKELVAQLGDWAALRARPSSTLEAMVLAAGGATGAEKLARLVSAASQIVRGRSNPMELGAPAAHVIRNGRGNRLVVLQAALATAGVPAHLVLVRPYSADPSAYRFPRGDLFVAAVLRVDLPEGPVWLDATLRQGPVGALPPALRGQEAWVVPLPGEEAQRIETPQGGPVEGEGRSLSFHLALRPDGRAKGTGVDELRGFEAAALRDALERLDADQRRQAVEAMLGRSLRGVALENVTSEGETSERGPARLLYSLSTPLGRTDGQELRLPASLLPGQLGRRFLQKAERTQPLLLDSPERVDSQVELELPPGFVVQGPPESVQLHTAAGDFRWQARVEKGRLFVDEALVLDRQRVKPGDFPAFAEFVRAVDRAQAREIVLVPSGKLAAR